MLAPLHSLFTRLLFLFSFARLLARMPGAGFRKVASDPAPWGTGLATRRAARPSRAADRRPRTRGDRHGVRLWRGWVQRLKMFVDPGASLTVRATPCSIAFLGLDRAILQHPPEDQDHILKRRKAKPQCCLPAGHSEQVNPYMPDHF